MSVSALKCEGGARDESELIGVSEPIIELKQIITRISRYGFPILIHGESGTGKELVARAIHRNSARYAKPFQALNCAALTDSLIEAELFGYVGGAFTGAHRKGSPSLFEAADKGTLFLDEVADLSMNAQAALLRVLEEGEVTRVGGRQTIPVDVRIITASNRSLDRLVEAGEFRQDLYHRLCVIPVYIAPLRERKDDIPALVRTFLERLQDPRYPDSETMTYLYRYQWPGNIRELEHCMDYMVAITDGPFTVESLPPHVHSHVDLDYTRTGFSEVPNNHHHVDVLTETHKNHDLQPDQLVILRKLDQANRTGVGLGRRSIAEEAQKEGLQLSESAIRTRLQRLRSMGLVKWGRGRSGVWLTAQGLELLSDSA